jgi:hypothetical protein
LGDPSGLGKRPGMIVGELEAAEAGHDVEGVLWPRQCVEVADPQIRLRVLFGSDFDQLSRRIYASGACPALGGQADETTRSASAVKNGCAGANLRLV